MLPACLPAFDCVWLPVACFVAAVRFIGGPNTREDYHLDLGSEFFFQMKGNMELPTIQQGKRKLVKINQGQVCMAFLHLFFVDWGRFKAHFGVKQCYLDQVFLLPSRIPHSPQRQKDTLCASLFVNLKGLFEVDLVVHLVYLGPTLGLPTTPPCLMIISKCDCSGLVCERKRAPEEVDGLRWYCK